MSSNDFYIRLVPFSRKDTSYRCDFTVEVRLEDDSLYATFGGAFSETKEDLLTRVATNLNTIKASPITKILKDPEVKKVPLSLKSLRKEMNTGVKHNLVKFSDKESLEKKPGGKGLEERSQMMRKLLSRFA